MSLLPPPRSTGSPLLAPLASPTLILCFDGTADAFDDDTTNVVRLFSALEKERPDRQMCYYQPGIGTYLGPSKPWSPALQALAKISDQGLAWYLDAHVMGGYRFLMQNYVKGDRICMFGFSRGAYTARCLAGMLNKVGLLPPSNEEHIAFAYKRYIDTAAGNDERAKGFKDAFSMVVEIAFVGVWDTVASCGLFGRNLPFTASNHIIRVFRHALALDERRSKFKPNPWHRNAHSHEAAANDPNQGTPVVPPTSNEPFRKETADDFIHYAMGTLKKRVKTETVWSDDREAYDQAVSATECDIREVWFPGCHADVGGGSVKNGTPHSLANAPLVWMINHIISANVGVIFKHTAFEGTEYQGLRPLFQRVTTPLPKHDSPSRDETASQISNREPAFRLETAEGCTEAVEIPNDEESHDPDAASKKLAITFAPDASKKTATHKRDTPVSSSRNDFPSLLQVVDDERTGTPQQGSTPASPISPVIATMRNGVVFSSENRSVPILLAPKDPKSGKALTGTEPRTLTWLTQKDPDADANSRLVDQLHEKKAWWLLEVVPLWQHYQDRNSYWHKGFRQNRGRAREVSDPKPLFHSSVKLREGYTPRAQLRGSEPTYVDF